jgi:PAS domain S-box-containing protein
MHHRHFPETVTRMINLGLPSQTGQPAFLAGGGELARLIAAFDWTTTSLGSIETWSSSLKSTIGLILRSPVPIVTLWGENGIMIYNDAYSGFAGRRHPYLLGSRVREGWPEVADFNDNVMKVGLAGGALSYQDQLLTLYRSGVAEQVWMDLDYSPILGEDGQPAGIVAIVVETTERVMAQRRLGEQARALETLNETLESRVAERTAERDQVWRNSRDLLAVAGADGIFRAVSPAWNRILGYQPEEVVGHHFLEFVYSEDATLSQSGFDQATNQHDLTNFENRFLHKDGTTRWISWHTSAEGGLVYGYGRDVTDEKARERTLELEQARFRTIYETTSQLMGFLEVDGTLIASNPASLDAIGVSFDQVEGAKFWNTPWFSGTPGMPEMMRQAIATAASGQAIRLPIELQLPTGETRHYDFGLTPVRNSAGEVVQLVPEAFDLTAQRKVEEQLRQAQKMEAVGQLTGGIAHDFNNLLTGITGSLELLGTRLAQRRLEDAERYIATARGAADRAAALTHRLLAFSRRQTLAPRPTDVVGLVASMEELISRTTGPSVAVEVTSCESVWTTMVDPNQLESALLNLCINARDAMPSGGRLTIATANCWLDASTAHTYDLPPGQYVTLHVTDTGTGMTPDVVARAFDPFFTTKPTGMGTGLGLSMIYGFARQSGGQARIRSKLGEGTDVCLYLPRYPGEAEDAEPYGDLDEAPRAADAETVLVVDDEPSIRMLVAEVLEDLGYSAIEAVDGATGLAVLRSTRTLDLLITDVGLPHGMNGRQLADAAREMRPDLKVLFITGYAENAVLSRGHLASGMHVMIKPFAMEALASRIRTIITET